MLQSEDMADLIKPILYECDFDFVQLNFNKNNWIRIHLIGQIFRMQCRFNWFLNVWCNCEMFNILIHVNTWSEQKLCTAQCFIVFSCLYSKYFNRNFNTKDYACNYSSVVYFFIMVFSCLKKGVWAFCSNNSNNCVIIW